MLAENGHGFLLEEGKRRRVQAKARVPAFDELLSGDRKQAWKLERDQRSDVRARQRALDDQAARCAMRRDAHGRENGLHKLTLSVVPHNGAAIGLYRKFGFAEEGRREKQIRRSNGEIWDLIEMGLQL